MPAQGPPLSACFPRGLGAGQRCPGTRHFTPVAGPSCFIPLCTDLGPLLLQFRVRPLP